jgi:hypothetical protein
MRISRVLALLAVAAALPVAATAATTKGSLKVTYWPHGRAGAAVTWTLRCAPLGGSHPRRLSACRALAEHAADLRPTSSACRIFPTLTSPRASLVGTWGSRRVSRAYRIGCPGWDDLHVVLTGK